MASEIGAVPGEFDYVPESQHSGQFSVGNSDVVVSNEDPAASFYFESGKLEFDMVEADATENIPTVVGQLNLAPGSDVGQL